MRQTANYQLSQWDESDRILREDFNSDNEKIDAAIAGANPLQSLGTVVFGTGRQRAGSGPFRSGLEPVLGGAGLL